MSNWTAKDRDKLRQWHAEGVEGPEMAKRLGRSLQSVRAALRRFRVRFRKRHTVNPELIRTLHAEGLTDQMISDRTGYSYATVARGRRAMGLKANWVSSENSSERARKICERLEVDNLNEARLIKWRVQCLLRGWPDAKTPARADVLDALESSGGRLTLDEIAAKIGRSRYTVRGHIRALARDGFVKRPGKGKGCVHFELLAKRKGHAVVEDPFDFRKLS